MAKKSASNKDQYDHELEDLTEEFDFDEGYEEGMEEMVNDIFKTHFAKIDFALRLTQMVLDNTAKKDGNDERVFDVYRRALKVINDSPAIEETLRQFGLMPEPQ